MKVTKQIAVMLIDDDVPMVEYLMQLIPWEKYNMDIIATAHSIEEAEGKLEKQLPHILITDIGLPDGNGIEFIRKVKRTHSDIKVIFLTCHEDFHYLKQALHLEADDYLLKDELNVSKLEAGLVKVVSKIREEQVYNESLAYKEDITRNKDVLIGQFFQNILLASDPGQMLQQGKRLGMHWEQPYFSLAKIHLNIGQLYKVYARKDIELIGYAAYSIAKELSEGQHIFPVLLQDAELWIVSNEQTKDHAKQQLLALLEALQQNIKHFLKIDSFATYCEAAVTLAELRASSDHIKATLEQQYYEGHWLCAARMKQADNDKAAVSAQLPAQLMEYVEKWKVSLKMNDQYSSRLYLHSIFKIVMEERLSYHRAKKIWITLLQQMIDAQVIAVNELLYADMNKMIRVQEPFDMLSALMQQDTADVATIDEMPLSSQAELRPINAYIYEHLHDNITSIDVANHLHLNPSYFSRYFKKLTSINFTDYIHLIKIAEAKRLLIELNETAENTAYILGYSDRAYFSKVFKKYTGISPSEAKQSK